MAPVLLALAALSGCTRPPPQAGVATARSRAVVRVALPDGGSLLVGATEVTRQDWEARMEALPSQDRGCPTCPVTRVSWFDAAAYANARSAADGLEPCYDLDGCAQAPEWTRKSGRGNAALHPRGLQCEAPVRAREGCAGWRLPTRTEWLVYAPVLDPDEPRRSILQRTVSGGAEGPSPVASRRPNTLGLYDTVGNVDEWLDEPVGPPSTAKGVRRTEATWCTTAGTCYDSTVRELLEPLRNEREVAAFGRSCLGFRVVRDEP